MLIRSQDKKSLINLDNLNNIRICIGKCEDVEVSRIYAESGIVSTNMPIAEYSTEAKAIKVLDMIQERYDCLNMYRNSPQDGYINSIFQMPQDKEV